MLRQKAMLIDIKRCIGCLSCETACKQLHGFSADPEPTLSDTAFTVVETRSDKLTGHLIDFPQSLRFDLVNRYLMDRA